jgi:transcription antitermination factor NusA-like protein
VLRYPLDRICIKSGVFCSHCQQKIESEVVERGELEVLKALVNLEDKLKFLRRGEYVKSILVGDDVYLFVKNGFDSTELNTLEQELSRELGRRVRVVEYTHDLRSLVEQILYPATIIGINRVWLPDGTEILSVRVSRRDKRHLASLKEQVELLIEKISGVKTRLSFD